MIISRLLIFAMAAILLTALAVLFLIYNPVATNLTPPISLTLAVARVEQPATATPPPRIPTESPTPTPVPTRALIKNTRLAWFYKPPASNDLQTLAHNFDLFILTRLDEPARDSLRALGLRQPFLQYYRFDGIHDPGGCNKSPYHNQIAMNPGEYCALILDHPDWFLRDARGNVLANVADSERYVRMDPGNLGWRRYWLDRARQIHEQYGWDGIFLDNVEASLSKLKRNDTRPATYTDDAQYQSAVEGFLGYISSYTKPRNKPLWANIIALDDPQVWFRYLTYLDGAMEESFAVDFGNQYLPPEVWEGDLARYEQTQALGKDVILVAQGTWVDLERARFAWATYLLVNNGRAFFRYANDNAYDQIWLYREYELQLGPPLGARYRDGNVWKREFENGSVMVDPVSHTTTITAR